MTLDKKDGGFVVTFRDLPEAITQGESLEEALAEAADCLDEAIANRIVMKLEVPRPSRAGKGQCPVAVPPVTAAKAALFLAMRESRMNRRQLAKRLGIGETAIGRLLDPRQQSRLADLRRALAALGKQLVVQVRDAA
ncbi:MAG: type II toxin-antitoxin system HicB family antitoxin [Bryobacteraceae bacterium]